MREPKGDKMEQIEAIIVSLAKDASVPSSFRTKARSALSDLEGLSEVERERRLAEFMEILNEARYDAFEEGPLQRRRFRGSRPPRGALPVADDTPWAPRRRARARKP